MTTLTHIEEVRRRANIARDRDRETMIHRTLECLDDAINDVNTGSYNLARMSVLGALYCLNTLNKRGGGHDD